MLRAIDAAWKSHISNMVQLWDRVYKPDCSREVLMKEYKSQADIIFNTMVEDTQIDTIHELFKKESDSSAPEPVFHSSESENKINIKFWKVSGACTVYLLGSIHATDGTIYPLDNAIEEAFTNSSHLAVEADIKEIPDELEYRIAEEGSIFGGLSIKDYVSEDTFKLYIKAYDLLKSSMKGISKWDYLHMKPWRAYTYLYQVLANLELTNTGGIAGNDSPDTGKPNSEQAASSFQLGVDLYFLRKAHKEFKQIVELEGVMKQIEIFSSFSKDIQDVMLHEALDEIAGNLFDDGEENETTNDNDTSSPGFRDIFDAWKNGDDDYFSDLFDVSDDTGDPQNTEFYEKLLVNRNSDMTQQIVEYLNSAGNGDYFVVVGFGHMVGETGIINQLIELGYDVREITT